MNKYKVFTLFFIIPIFCILLFHALIWNFLTYSFDLSNKNYPGDLARTIYKKDSLFIKPNHGEESFTLKKKHIDIFQWNKTMKVDLITIGDSFSNGESRGLNPYYQDYIATNKKLNVLNLRKTNRYTDNFLETIYLLINSKLIDDINPKYILIESVERYAVDRFTKKFNQNININKNKLLKELSHVYTDEVIKSSFMNDKNLDILIKHIKYTFNEKKYGLHNNVNVVAMKRDFFTSKDKNSLLFWNGDISSISNATKNNIIILNNNLNNLATILKNKKIKLYFMPAVDKYNLYSPYIINNKYPASSFFENLRLLPKEYELIDTKAILSNELETNSKDIYYSDDTHWSFKASEIIFEKVKFE